MPTTIKTRLGRAIPRDLREWSAFFEGLRADHIKNGQTDYDTGVGFFIGDHDGTPKLSIGNSAGNKITWNGTTLSIVGTITATTGTIGGWTLAATYLEAGSGATLVRLDSGGVNPAISAGSATPASAPFRVTQAGALTATSATITGSVTATSGAIGGWTLASSYFEAGSGATLVRVDSGGTNPAFSAGSATPASAPFRVTQGGALTATSATITGAITATSGSFTGGVTVGSGGSLSSGQSAYDTGTGYWLEYNGGTPRFSIGNASGNKLTWNGSLLTVNGQIELGNVQTFAPTWAGFSSAPTGNLKYVNLGNLAIIWGDSGLTTGTSNATNFSFSNGPAALVPTSIQQCLLYAVDNGGTIQATALVSNSGPNLTVAFHTNDVSGSHIVTNSAGWTNSGLKYLSPGFVLIYALS